MMQYRTMNPSSLESTNTTIDFLAGQANMLVTTIAPLHVSVASLPAAVPCSSYDGLSSMKTGSGCFGSGNRLQRGTSSAGNFPKNASFSSGNRGSSRNLSRTAHSNSTNFATVCGSASVSAKNWSGAGVMQTAQRSNAASVKSVIADLQRVCETAETSEPPLRICSMLAQWASVDAYYKVVITKYNGIQSTIRAMHAFLQSADLQSMCCTILATLSNKCLIFQEGGAYAIVEAMKRHPSSIIVQSAALEALSPLTPLLLQEQAMLREIQALVQCTADMYLTKAGSKAGLDITMFLKNLPLPND